MTNTCIVFGPVYIDIGSDSSREHWHEGGMCVCVCAGGGGGGVLDWNSLNLKGGVIIFKFLSAAGHRIYKKILCTSNMYIYVLISYAFWAYTHCLVI